MRLLSRLVLLTLVVAAPAFAFPWMVKHNYGSCAACHVDPSGAGQTTLYGRAQSETLLRFKLERPKANEEPDLPKTVNFLWFAELPEAINLSGNVRGGAFIRPSSQAAPVIPLVMATDLYGTVNLGNFVAHATVGPGIKRVEKAIVLPACDPSTSTCGVSLTAREYWAGFKLADEAVMLRAGRMFLPFGLRNNEHYTWVRTLTRTNTNLDQQVGLSASFNSEKLRGELMGIAGNYQTGPDVYRERGYSMFAEYTLAPNAYLMVSSLVTHAGADLETTLPTTRHAHGAALRWAPTESLAILAEGDLLAWQSPNKVDRVGFAAMAQADYELFQGLHLMGTLEGMHQGDTAPAPSLGVWGSVAWYALPHCEFRVDGIYRSLSSQAGASGDFSLLAQLHFFL